MGGKVTPRACNILGILIDARKKAKEGNPTTMPGRCVCVFWRIVYSSEIFFKKSQSIYSKFHSHEAVTWGPKKASQLPNHKTQKTTKLKEFLGCFLQRKKETGKRFKNIKHLPAMWIRVCMEDAETKNPWKMQPGKKQSLLYLNQTLQFRLCVKWGGKMGSWNTTKKWWEPTGGKKNLSTFSKLRNMNSEYEPVRHLHTVRNRDFTRNLDDALKHSGGDRMTGSTSNSNIQKM